MPTIHQTYSGLALPSAESRSRSGLPSAARDGTYSSHSSIDHVTICLQTIASAKKDVYDFTIQVSTWFYTVETSFRGATKKKFSMQAKKNLNVIRYVLCPSFPQRIAKCSRNLINEICKWGWARVVRLDYNKFLDAIKYAKLE